MLQKNKKSLCLYSKEEFYPSRSNQKFANRQCRVDYHNDKNNTIRKKTAFINKPLMKNYKIFSELLADKSEGIYHSQFLIGKGFSFKIFTNLKEYNDGYAYAIFEFWYYKIDTLNFKVKKT
jgi:hypothetical protein